MADEYVERTYRREAEAPGYLQRVGSSAAGMCFSPVVLLFAVWLLFMNEGWAIKTHQTLNEVRDNAIHIQASSVLNENYGKLIHATHKVSVEDPLVDDVFQISRHAVTMTRHVDMYQWVQKSTTQEKKLSNGEVETTTRYTYSKDWRSDVQQNFKKPEGHRNPGSFLYESQTLKSSTVNFGAFELGSTLVEQLTRTVKVPVSASGLPLDIKKIARVSGYYVHIPGESVEQDGIKGAGISRHIESVDGEEKIIYELDSTGERFSSKQKAQHALSHSSHAGGTKVGDMRISFDEVPCSTVSVLAKQSDSTLTDWSSSIPGYSYGMVADGVSGVDEMVEGAQSANNIFCWVKRVSGFVICWIAFSMMTSLLHTLVDWVPLIRNLVSLGLTIMNGVLAVTVTFVTISVGWIFYRPMIGCSLLAIGLGALYMASAAGAKKNPTTVETVKKE